MSTDFPSRRSFMMDRSFFVFIMTNRPYGALYVGVTNDLAKRAWHHRNHVVEGFTDRHRLERLVWYEVHESAYEAIRREKLIEKWHRDWKINLIQGIDPGWEDLFARIAV